MSLLRRAWEGATRPRGSRTWDGIVRATGVLALLGIPLAHYVPATASLIGFVLVTIWVNGPLAMFLPATYEPILMLFGRLHPPLLIAVLGTAGTLYIELLNYLLYRIVLRSDLAETFRESRLVRRVVDLFERMPFFTIWICSWSILPYWPVRFLSPLSGYSLKRHLLATFLGRFPRLWFFAALGVWWGVPDRILLAVTAGGIALGVGIWLYRRWRGRRSPRKEAVEELREEAAEELRGGAGEARGAAGEMPADAGRAGSPGG